MDEESPVDFPKRPKKDDEIKITRSGVKTALIVIAVIAVLIFLYHRGADHPTATCTPTQDIGTQCE